MIKNENAWSSLWRWIIKTSNVCKGDTLQEKPMAGSWLSYGAQSLSHSLCHSVTSSFCISYSTLCLLPESQTGSFWQEPHSHSANQCEHVHRSTRSHTSGTALTILSSHLRDLTDPLDSLWGMNHSWLFWILTWLCPLPWPLKLEAWRCSYLAPKIKLEEKL